MAVSDGADGSDSFARSVIVDAPGMARFEGVWLIGTGVDVLYLFPCTTPHGKQNPASCILAHMTLE